MYLLTLSVRGHLVLALNTHSQGHLPVAHHLLMSLLLLGCLCPAKQLGTHILECYAQFSQLIIIAKIISKATISEILNT